MPLFLQNLNTFYNGRCYTFNPLKLKVPIITPVNIYLNNPWMKSEKPGKYIFYIHDEGLEFNLISQVVNFFSLNNCAQGPML